MNSKSETIPPLEDTIVVPENNAEVKPVISEEDLRNQELLKEIQKEVNLAEKQTILDEIAIAQKKKGDGTESFNSSTTASFRSPSSFKKVGGFKNVLLRTTMALAGMFGINSAIHAEGNPGDSTKINKTEVNFSTARKVKEIPPGYERVIKNGIQYGIQQSKSEETPAPTAKPAPEHKKHVSHTTHRSGGTSFLKKAAPAHTVANPKETITSDVVYIEAEQEKPMDKFTAFGRDEQVLFDSAQHGFARMYHIDRSTNVAEENGWDEENTVAIIFGGDKGPDGKRMILTLTDPIDPSDPSKGVLRDVFGASTTHIARENGIEILKKRALVYEDDKDKTYELTNEDLKQGTSVVRN